jgi:trans-aconitate methyltransferase
MFASPLSCQALRAIMSFAASVQIKRMFTPLLPVWRLNTEADCSSQTLCEKENMNTYNWNAKDYERNSQAQQEWARELIATPSLKGMEDVLDLGCGDGKVTAEIARSVGDGSVVGIDNSSQMIDLAKEKYPQDSYSNLSFQAMDAGDLSFEGCFDVVFSNAVLHWVKDHKPVVDGLYKSLRAGGKILLRMGGQGDAEGIISAINDVKASNQWAQYFTEFEFPYNFVGIDETQVLLKESGFSINRVELIPKDMTHDGKSGLEGWIRTTWLPYTERIPKEKREAFIEAVASSYLDKVPLGADGKAHVAMVLIEVEAEKIT